MSVTVFVCMLSFPGLLEVWKHEWYHVATNCQGHVLSPSGLPKVAKNHKKSQKSPEPCSTARIIYCCMYFVKCCKATYIIALRQQHNKSDNGNFLAMNPEQGFVWSQGRWKQLKTGCAKPLWGLKSGCAKLSFSLFEAQKVGAQMRTLAH